jgi:uncharacterized membrane protein
MIDAYWLEWGNLLLRWLHVIVAIAWIGSSFYFVFLDNNLVDPQSPEAKAKGVSGEIWAVHGGGFYNPQKYMVAPKQKIDSKLHWFYWESYSTFLSGFALFTLLYLYNASTFLIDKSVFDWTPPVAITTALAFLVVFWFIYDFVCRTFGFKKNGEMIVGGIMMVVIIFASWLACHLFAGRAAFLLIGAMMATAMSANVFFWIIPGQRKVVAAMKAGIALDPKELAMYGKRGKQRSVHNTYFTLPVIFTMLSNHYSFLYTNDNRWVILVLMMLAGALIRQFFVQRHGYHHGRAKNPVGYAIVGGVVIFVVIAMLKPAPSTPSVALALQEPVGYVKVNEIMQSRCIACHGAQVQLKNVRLDSPESIKKHAAMVYQQVVVTRQMPMNNSTGITEEERLMIKNWYQNGAPTQ